MTNKDGKPGLALNMNDTFFWGCADAEDIEYADAPALLEIAKRDGPEGLIAYARDKRMARGEGWDEEHLATYTPGLGFKVRAESAERRLAEAIGLLRDLEWAGFGSTGYARFCPACTGESTNDHRDDCRLAALLSPPPPPSGTSYLDNGEGFREGNEG